MKQLPLLLGPGPAQSFENFAVGANAVAVDALRTASSSSTPFYLWGPAGAGKTHLLRALAREAAVQGRRVGAFDPSLEAPWPWGDGVDLVLLDGCDDFDAARQHAAFALFVEAATHGVPVAAAGRVPPTDLPLREDLRSRLGWGHVFTVRPLSEPEARATLRRVADERGIFLSDDVMDYLLTRFARDLKHLIGQLDRLDQFSLATKRTITVPLLKQMLVEEGAG